MWARVMVLVTALSLSALYQCTKFPLVVSDMPMDGQTDSPITVHLLGGTSV